MKKKYMYFLGVIVLVMIIIVIGRCYMSQPVMEDKKIEISYGHFQGEGDAMYNSIQDAIGRFQSDYPNVVVKQVYYPSDAYGVRLERWNEQNTMPDITMILGSNIETYVANNSIQDMTELVSNYGITRKIEPDYFKEQMLDDKIYAVPWERASYGFIMYNKGIFEEVGIEEFPTTIEGLIEASDMIVDAGYIPMALGNKLLWPVDSILFSAFVNNYVGTEWYDSILAMDGNASFLDEEFVTALKDFQRLGESNLFNSNFSSLDNEQRGELYQNREAAMISAGNWECKSTTEVVPEVAEETYIALWPTPEAGTLLQNSVVASSAWGIAMSSQIEKEKMHYAMTFISEYICSDEFARIMAEEQGVYTPWGDTYDSTTINIISKREQEVSQQNNVTQCLNWDSTLPVVLREIYQNGLQGILLGTETPENLANKLEEARGLLMENQ